MNSVSLLKLGVNVVSWKGLPKLFITSEKDGVPTPISSFIGGSIESVKFRPPKSAAGALVTGSIGVRNALRSVAELIVFNPLIRLAGSPSPLKTSSNSVKVSLLSAACVPGSLRLKPMRPPIPPLPVRLTSRKPKSAEALMPLASTVTSAPTLAELSRSIKKRSVSFAPTSGAPIMMPSAPSALVICPSSLTSDDTSGRIMPSWMAAPEPLMGVTVKISGSLSSKPE